MLANKVFISFTEITERSRHRDYNAWHQLDHRPENLALDGVRHGERWVRTPACAAAGSAGDARLENTHYVNAYWFAEPAEESIREWQGLAERAFQWGRRPEGAFADRPLMGFFTTVKGYAHPRVLVSPDALVYRPNRGIYVQLIRLADPHAGAVERLYARYDREAIPLALASPAVAGAWTMSSDSTTLDPSWRPRAGSVTFEATGDDRGHLRLLLAFVDGDPLAAAPQIAASLAGVGLAEAGAEEIFSGPLLAITPWEWDWFDDDGDRAREARRGPVHAGPAPAQLMQYRQLGTSGLSVSVLGLGCNNFSYRVDAAGAQAIVDACFEVGVSLFDTADFYGDSEVLLGHALRGRREDAVVATKFGNDLGGRLGTGAARGSRRYIRRAVEASLRRLGTDYIDLYQQHVPDPATPLEETLGALCELVDEGKVRYIGSSNLPAWRVADADAIARRSRRGRFVSAQNRYNLLEREAEAELLPCCRHHGVGLIAYFPLANGLLSGKYRRGEPAPAGARLTDMAVPWRTGPPGRRDVLNEENLGAVEAIARYGATRGVGVLEVALGGLAAQPGVSSLIAGASRPEQVRANAAAISWTPSAQDVAALDETLAATSSAAPQR